MAGIYIHIPFCKQACSYCDFYFLTSGKYIEDFIEALKTEIRLRKHFLTDTKIETIYFGGGTPSILTSKHLNEVFDCLALHFDLSNLTEVTLEINPEDLNPSAISALKQMPINRFSIGLQCFQDPILKWMNRTHSSEQGISAVKRIQDAGFDNLSADLIYGIPSLTDTQCKSNVKTIIDMDIPHISCYCLTLEEGTAFWHQVKKGQIKSPDEAQGSSQFDIIMECLETDHYEHYEISNFALAGKRSKHNTNYWRYLPYLGLGPSAHSFDGTNRYSNIANIHIYLEKLHQGKTDFISKEELTEINRINERIMIQLRLKEGIYLDYFEQNIVDHLHLKSEKWHLKGMLNFNSPYLSLTQKGKHFADAIATDLFLTV